MLQRSAAELTPLRRAAMPLRACFDMMSLYFAACYFFMPRSRAVYTPCRSRCCQDFRQDAFEIRGRRHDAAAPRAVA